MKSPRDGLSIKPASQHLPPETYFLREAAPKDLDRLHELSTHLDSVNLPHDPKLLKKLIKKSHKSFTGQIEDPLRREYLFVLEDASTQKILGTSMLIAQHGHPDAPHVYFDVLPDERYSVTLDRHFHHICLRLGLSYRGPTEIGGLVLDPSARSLGLGKALSFVRFLFIGIFRDRFRPWVIAELLPPLEPDGKSALWEYLGRPFTGLDYKEADRLSQKNKEFIISLFPQTPIYASMLPYEIQRLIGQVGQETLPVQRMLESIGFEYSERIDPFDGGPHFHAQCEDITLIRNTRELTLSSDLSAPGGQRVMVATAQRQGSTRFKALPTLAEIDPGGEAISITKSVREILGVKSGGSIFAMPF